QRGGDAFAPGLPPQRGELRGERIVDRARVAANVDQPRGERLEQRRAAAAAPLVEGERRQPALRDLLAAVDGGLRQAVHQRRIGEARQQRVGVGYQILTGGGREAGGGLLAHQPLDLRA